MEAKKRFSTAARASLVAMGTVLAVLSACTGGNGGNGGGGGSGSGGSGSGGSGSGGSSSGGSGSGGSSSGATGCALNYADGTISGDGYDVTITHALVMLTFAQATPPVFSFGGGAGTANLGGDAGSKKGVLAGITGTGVLDIEMLLDGTQLDANGAAVFTESSLSPTTGSVLLTVTNGATVTTLGANSPSASNNAAGSWTLTIDGSTTACGSQVGALHPITSGSLTGTLVDVNNNPATFTLTF
jgi:hypothetical protein